MASEVPLGFSASFFVCYNFHFLPFFFCLRTIIFWIKEKTTLLLFSYSVLQMPDIQLTKSHVEPWKTFWRSFHVDIEGDETMVMKTSCISLQKIFFLWFDLPFIFIDVSNSINNSKDRWFRASFIWHRVYHRGQLPPAIDILSTVWVRRVSVEAVRLTTMKATTFGTLKSSCCRRSALSSRAGPMIFCIIVSWCLTRRGVMQIRVAIGARGELLLLCS